VLNEQSRRLKLSRRHRCENWVGAWPTPLTVGWLTHKCGSYMLRFENGFWSFDDAYHLHHKQLKQNVR